MSGNGVIVKYVGYVGVSGNEVIVVREVRDIMQ